jgi:uncharacterized protein YdaU (DUF1376 family)
MHYFKMNIGDYAKKAGRLSMIEHGAYTLLIHSCYDRERFPTLEDAIDWCWARTDEEKAAVQFVLSKFFDLQDGFYVQSRIQEEIDKYHENATTNKRIATEREEKRRNKARTLHELCSSVNEPPPNQEPLTNNHKPLKTLNPIDQNSDDFDRFWEKYPNKKAKIDAQKAWKKHKPDIELVLKAISWQVKSKQWLDGFVPHPATYINGGRWLDVPVNERTTKPDILLQKNKENVEGWKPPEMREVL